MKRSSAALRQRLRKRVSVFHLPSPVDCAHLDNNISTGINSERLGALEPMPAFKPPRAASTGVFALAADPCRGTEPMFSAMRARNRQGQDGCCGNRCVRHVYVVWWQL